MIDILELADRCEKVPEGSRDLDIEILRAMSGKDWRWHNGTGKTVVTWPQYGCGAPGNPICSLEEFTSSIDDAVMLIPEGWFFSGLNQQSPAVRVWTEGNGAHYSPGLDGLHAATPALAICAAALRARADVGSSLESSK